MQQEEVTLLYLDDIIPNRFQPREIFDERALKELAVSIKEHGVIQPIIVRKANDKYEIIAGERRYKASALAGLTKIPAIIRDLDDKEASKVALLENLQRKNLNPLEEARTYQKILELDEMTQESLAKTMGKSQSAVANKIRLLSLPEEIQEAILKEQISERHARALLNVDSKEKQMELLNDIINNKMSVRQVEERIKGDSNQVMENNNASQNPEQIGNETFVSNKPLMPSFTLEEDKQEEPFIIPGQQKEETSADNTNDIQKEPMIINPYEHNSNEENQPLIINNNNNPTEEEDHKFINFGEITEDGEEDEESNLYQENVVEEKPKEEAPVPTESTFSPPADIPDQSNTGGINLDSLLNIGMPTTDFQPKEEDSTTPAEKAIQESEQEEKEEGEYFKAPDLIGVDLPGQESDTSPDNTNISATTPDSNILSNPIEAAVGEINSALSKIEAMGIKIDKDELNLSNSYQVVIKLEK